MDRTMTEFIRALRGSHIRVSTAESLVAFEALNLVGYSNRQRLKDSLAACLSKSEIEKEYFDSCFERFFTVERVNKLQEETEDLSPEDIQEDLTSPEQMQGDGFQQSPSGGGGEGNPQQSMVSEVSENGASLLNPSSSLGQMLLSGDQTAFSLALNRAAQQVDIASIRSFTQRGLFGRRMMMEMGLEDLETEIREGIESEDIRERELARRLTRARDFLRAEVREYVERQLVLFTEAQGEQFREEVIRNISLSNMELRAFSNLNEIVRRMAKKLVAMHARRRKIYNRGQLNVRKTLQSNMAYDGTLFNLKWKSSKVDRPRVMAVCDVSGSVAEVSRFLLMFLYSLNEVMPNVRSFAFSSGLGEVTDHFEKYELQEAVQEVISDWGRGSSDFGQSWLDLKRLAYEDIDHRTTIIILGDARNNYREHRSEVLKEISERARQIIWLNPENKNKWSQGDSVMNHYAPYCKIVETCNTLNHLEGIINKLLKTAN